MRLRRFLRRLFAPRPARWLLLPGGAVALLLAGLWWATLDRIGDERRQALDAEGSRARRLAWAYEQQVRQALQPLDQALRLLASEPELARALARGTASVPPSFVRIGLDVGLVNVQGRPATAAPDLPPGWAEELVAIHRVRSPELAYLHPPARREPASRWVTTLSRAIWLDGELVGVAYAPLDPRALVAFYEQGALAAGDALLLFDAASGETRARRSREGFEWAPAGLADLPADVLQEGSGTLVAASPRDGIQRAYGLRELPEYGLVAAVGLLRAQGVAPVRARARGLVLAAGLASTLIVLGGFLLAVALRRHRQSLARLERSERQFRTLAQMSPDWYWETDEIHRFTRATWAPRHGGDHPVIVLGRPRWEQPGIVGSDETWAQHRAELDRHLPFRDLEVRRLDAQGRERVALISGDPVFGAQGRFRGYRGIGHEITAQLDAQAALEASEESYRLLFENTRDGLLIGQGFGQVDQVNAAACRLLDRPAAQLLSLGLSVLEGPGNPLDAVRDTAEREGWAKGEFEVLRPDGARVRLEVTFTRYFDSGNHRRSSVLLHDVTPRHEAQRRQESLAEQLRQSQKMEALGSIAGGIAHDFNNVVAAILGNARLAQHAHPGPGPASRYLDEIQRAGLRARELVRRIMTFSRQQPAVFVRQPLGPVVLEAVDLLRATLPSGVRITLQGGESEVEVMADANQIHQVLMNLGTNAWQALEGRSGRIDVRIEAPAGSGWVALSVQDNGAGMDEPTQVRMFEPFFTTKREGEGTGLGLAVVQGIVQAHFGEIAVHSQRGQGTRIEIRLPVATERGGETEVASPVAEAPREVRTDLQRQPLPAVHGGGRHVVYVDDYEAMVAMVGAVLQARGFRVTGFASSVEALEHVRGNGASVDLLITDHNMPDLSGLDLGREVRALRPGLPIILASGHVDPELRDAACAAGISALFDKPAGIDELCRLVVEQLAPER